MEQLRSFLRLMPALNSFAGLALYTLVAYLVVMLLGWCINSSSFDPDAYHEKMLRERLIAKRAKKD